MARRPTLLVCLLTAAMMFAVWTPPASAGARGNMVRTINFVRNWSNVPDVRYSARMSRRASAWARSLIRRGYLAHSSSAGGEVIEWHSGTRPRVRRTVDSWLRSPLHARVIMSRRYRRVGAGRAVGLMNGRRVTIWVVRFGRG